MNVNDLDLTATQLSLFDLAQRIPEGRWCSYGDMGDALAVVTGSGSARGAASAEDSLRLKMGASLGVTDPDRLSRDDVGTPYGYPWWRIRNDEGLLVHGGVGRDRQVILDPNSGGNIKYRAEGGTIVGGGYAPQSERYNLAGVLRPVVDTVEPICSVCFLRPCQCEND